MASVNRTHRYFWAQLLDLFTSGGSALEGATLKAMILDTTTTVDTEWDTQGQTTGLGDFSTMGELSSGSRVTLGSVTTAISGTQAFLDFLDPVWSSLAAGSNTPEHILFYAEESGASADPSLSNRWPVALVDASFTPDGTDFTAVIPLNGILSHESQP